jgi:hypothetical protein
MTTIYTLKLEQGKYYIGRTTQPKHRILNHFTDNGSEWTKKYKPISVVSQIKGDEFDEEKYTLIAMDKYGVENVRGGSYCKVKLTNNDIEKAQQTIYSITDKCYKCGKKGHFVKNCGKETIVCDDNPELYEKIFTTEDICVACSGTGTSYWSDDIYGSCLECCCINCSEFYKDCKCRSM